MQISYQPNATICATIAVATICAITLSACAGHRTILHGSHAVRAPRPERSKNTVTVWFVKSSKDGDLKLASVVRAASSPDKLQSAIDELLEGPSAHEENDGLGTEIPRGTILIDVKRSPKQIELNLSRRFATGGGTSSFETRMEQLRRTVTTAADAPVYLNVEGKRFNLEEGEGIEIPQPINR
jgi:spore germination protein GerM